MFNDKVFVFFLIVFLIILLKIRIVSYTVKLKEKEQIIQMNNLYNPIILNLLDDVRQKQHDFKNHINTIYGIAQTTNQEELKDKISTYIKNLNSSLEELENFIYLDNTAISAILFSKNCEAKSKDVNFICHINESGIDKVIKEYEISII